MTVSVPGCNCPDPRRSNSYHAGHESRSCNGCARVIVERPWHLTADGLREFLLSAGEGSPALTDDELKRFASLVIPRVIEQGARDYGLHGFLERVLDERESEEELADVTAYLHMRALKDRWEVHEGLRDAEQADERERRLMNLAAKTILLNEEIRYFFHNH